MLKNFRKISLRTLVRRLPLIGLLLTGGILFSNMAFAGAQDIGSVASNITGTFSNLAKLITGAAYIAGFGFALAAILKFKQHKDNPTQVPIGTPIGLLFVAAALIYLPAILGTAGATLFGSGNPPTQATVGGVTSI